MLVLLTAGHGRRQPDALSLVEALADAGHDVDVRLLADNTYSHPSTRTFLRGKQIKHTIPEHIDQIARRKVKGSAGRRPPGFDAELYALRNAVERSFNLVTRTSRAVAPGALHCGRVREGSDWLVSWERAQRRTAWVCGSGVTGCGKRSSAPRR